jgi:microcystin-dependent protein
MGVATSGDGQFWTTTFTATSSSGAANIQNTGGGQSHNNMQPSLVVNFIIKHA